MATEMHTDVRQFVDEHIKPYANRFDKEEFLPDSVIQALADAHLLVATLPKTAHGRGTTMREFGTLNEIIGTGCQNVRNLIAVQGMVAHTILKFGSAEQRNQWVSRIGSGECIAAFMLTEPHIGSDARHIQMTATPDGTGYILNGCKTWISFGQRADIFLVLAQAPKGPSLFLVEREQSEISIEPIQGLMGLRASGLARITFDDCEVSATQLVGKEGFGFYTGATVALGYGRYSTACGAVGLAQACLDASLRYAEERVQFDVPIKQHQLVQRMLSDMIVNVEAARLLCERTGNLRDMNSTNALHYTLMAKYLATTTAFKCATDAVQIHGANGIGGDYPVQRYLRDAKVLEIIEGTTELHQSLIVKTKELS